MKVEYRESFENDISILDKNLLQKVFGKINVMKNINNIEELNNTKKLKGYKNIYRIRIGDYRLGFSLNQEIIILERFLHRKDIYKKFPKK